MLYILLSAKEYDSCGFQGAGNRRHDFLAVPFPSLDDAWLRESKLMRCWEPGQSPQTKLFHKPSFGQRQLSVREPGRFEANMATTIQLIFECKTDAYTCTLDR